VIGERRDLGATRVGDVATRDVVTVDAEQPVRSVVETFRGCRFRHLPVVRGGRVVGILSTRDFLAFVVDGLEDYVEKARYDQQLASGTDPYDHIGGAYGR
jgi:CBS domain-containing protein